MTVLKRLRAGAAVTVLILAAIAAANAIAPARSALAQDAVPVSAAQIQLSFAPLVKQVSPAVVNVYVTRRVQRPSSDDLLQEFGRGLFGPRERLENSLGSGVLVSADGLIVTNNHVIKGSGEAEIRVALADKREFDAKLILKDEQADLAVLRIVATDVTFPFLEFHDSDDIEVGDLVLAIGNPFGVGQTVTSGIVSALARTTVARSDSQYFIQTDAAINPGNSGGALVNMKGRLVGINTMIFSRSGGSIGIGFAIPSNLAKPFVDSAISGREIKRPWLGAKLAPVDRDVAQALGLEKVEGAMVAAVNPNSPAGRAGLQPRDVVVALDGREIEDPRAMTYRLNTKEIGGTARIKLIRDREPMEVDLELAEAPSLKATAQVQISGAHPLDGVRVLEVSNSLAEELGASDLAGVVVAAVPNGSFAQSYNIRPGDVVLRVNGRRIARVPDLVESLNRARSRWNLDFRRGGAVYTLVVGG